MWDLPWVVTADRDSLWLRFGLGEGALGLRLAYCPAGVLRVHDVTLEATRLDFILATDLGVVRATVDPPGRDDAPLHVRSSLTPTESVVLPEGPRDLMMWGGAGDGAETEGVVHTSQRGPRSGVVYGSMTAPEPTTFFYLQDFGASARYFQETGSSPAGRVGGEWPALGYSMPGSGDKQLHRAEDYILSDAFVCLVRDVPDGPVAAAQLYLDLLARVYLAMDRPLPAYRDWPAVAEATLRDLTFSPEVSQMRDGRRYLLPYVGDRSKPPESMVQFTVLLPVREYGEWSDRKPRIGRELLSSIPSFFDEGIGSLVRWLPGAPFLEQTEDVQEPPRDGQLVPVSLPVQPRPRGPDGRSPVEATVRSGPCHTP